MIQPTATHRHQHAPHGRANPSASAASVLGFALPGEPEGDALAGSDGRQDAAGDGNVLPGSAVLDPFAALAAFPAPLTPEAQASPLVTAAPDADLPGTDIIAVERFAALPSAGALPITGSWTADPSAAPAVTASSADIKTSGAVPLAAAHQPAATICPPPIASAVTSPGELRVEAHAMAPPVVLSAAPVGAPAATLAAAAIPIGSAQGSVTPVASDAQPVDASLSQPVEHGASFGRPAPASRDTAVRTAHAPHASAPGVAAPAGVVFAARLAAQAGRDQEQPPLVRPQGEPLGIAGVAEMGGVAAPASSGGPALDMAQHGWPEAMIERIEALRDAADAADTSIRLLPDALGSVEVGLRQEGETLHVRFTAAEAQTRALLQDAQPRLAEAAEARGLRLGQTSVDAGASGQPQGEPRQPPADAGSRRPAPASADTDDANTDDRIA